MNLRDLFLRVRALCRSPRVERELDEELAFHIERETENHIAAGLSPIEARTRARARFGPVPLAADQCRDALARGRRRPETRHRLRDRTFRRRRSPLSPSRDRGTSASAGRRGITVYNMFFLRFFVRCRARPRELFAVQLTGRERRRQGIPLTRPDYDAMRREPDVFTDAFAMQIPETRF